MNCNPLLSPHTMHSDAAYRCLYFISPARHSINTGACTAADLLVYEAADEIRADFIVGDLNTKPITVSTFAVPRIGAFDFTIV